LLVLLIIGNNYLTKTCFSLFYKYEINIKLPLLKMKKKRLSCGK
jgi:hypothetical protein